jgi:hypothetical protein
MDAMSGVGRPAGTLAVEGKRPKVTTSGRMAIKYFTLTPKASRSWPGLLLVAARTGAMDLVTKADQIGSTKGRRKASIFLTMRVRCYGARP